jgi:hypothetical protein
MITYCDEVHKLDERFDGIELYHILWYDNEATDILAKLASSRELAPLGVIMNRAHEPSIKRDRPPDPSTGQGAPDHVVATTPDVASEAAEGADPSQGDGEGPS